MVKKSITCISLLFIGYGISYLYLDHRNNIKDLTTNELLVGKYFSKEAESKDISIEIQKEEEYIAVLEIPRINFKRGLYEKGTPNNKLDKNIVFLDKSEMPNQINSRVIIVGHSGNSNNSYFRYLYKIKYKDSIYLYYDNIKYTYIVKDIYEIKKTGTLALETNTNKTLTLVTCKGSDLQLVIISELKKEEKLV